MGVWGGGDVSCIPCVRRFACTRPLRGAKGRFFPSALVCKGELMGVWGGGDVSCIPCVRRFACTRPLRGAKGRFFPSALVCKGELMGVWGGGDVSCIPCVRHFACTRPLRSAKGRFGASPHIVSFVRYVLLVWRRLRGGEYPPLRPAKGTRAKHAGDARKSPQHPVLQQSSTGLNPLLFPLGHQGGGYGGGGAVRMRVVMFRASPACGALLARVPFAERRGGLPPHPTSCPSTIVDRSKPPLVPLGHQGGGYGGGVV